MKEHHPQSLVDPGNGLGIQAQITSQSISRLLLIKALQDGNLATQLREAFLLAAEHAFNIATRGFNRLKRTTKNTFTTIKKVVAQLKTISAPITISISKDTMVTKHSNYRGIFLNQYLFRQFRFSNVYI